MCFNSSGNHTHVTCRNSSQEQLVGEAEVQKYMFTYHTEGNFILCLYCTFRSIKYISAC